MIVYDNSHQFSIIFNMTGSVLPSCLPVGIFCGSVGLTLAMLRHFGKMEAVFGTDRLIVHSFSMQTIAVVIGYLLVVRTNMALGRWMHGIGEIQLMLSKWGDAFDALSGFFAGRGGDEQTRMRILNFRIRVAHWFSLMSCLAFATLRNGGKLETLDDVPIKEMFADRKSVLRKSFSACRVNEDAADTPTGPSGGRTKELIEGLDLLVLATPTKEEVELLEIANDKVNTVCLWIIQGIILEIRAGTLDIAPPIASRVFQEVSNGMLGYNQAHKVAMVPFPFPFAQMVSLLLVTLYIAMPFYIDMFTQQLVITPLISFLLPVCYCGLNRIAIELEEPFGTDWNDVDIEVRHEEFLWMLVDVLRQPDVSPRPNGNNDVEHKILTGCSRNVPLEVLASEVKNYMFDVGLGTNSREPSEEASNQGSSKQGSHNNDDTYGSHNSLPFDMPDDIDPLSNQD